MYFILFINNCKRKKSRWTCIILNIYVRLENVPRLGNVAKKYTDVSLKPLAVGYTDIRKYFIKKGLKMEYEERNIVRILEYKSVVW